MTDWGAYIQDNRPGGFECQVVSALNAWAFYHGRRYCEQDSYLYTAMVRLAKAETEGASEIDKVYKSLGLTTGQDYQYANMLKKYPWPMPMRIRIVHKNLHFEYHECLVVEQSKQCDAVRVAGFATIGSSQGWVFKEDLYQWIRGNGAKDPWFAKHVARMV